MGDKEVVRVQLWQTKEVVDAVWAVIDRSKELAMAEVSGHDESASIKFNRALNHLSDVLGVRLNKIWEENNE